MKALLVGGLLAALASAVYATSPKLNATTPPGAQRGTEILLRLSGSRLEDAQEIVFSTPAIKVLKMESVRTNSIKATVRIAPDCALGEHQLRVRTATGVSDLRTFWISAYTNVDESEPNNELAKAQRVSPGVTINGSAGGEDTDFYRVDVRKGQRISAEVEAIRLGRGMLDAYLAICDREGRILASADDTTLLMQDATVSIFAPKDGAYFVQMRDSTYSGGDSAYRLHVGSFPRPMMVFPLGGQVGERISLRFIGDLSGEFSQEIQLPATPSDKFGAFAEQGEETAPSPNWIRVSNFGNQLESEPNDTRQTATAYYNSLPIALNGVISKKNDVDFFRFTAKNGDALDINVYARRLRSPLDSAIDLYDVKGAKLASNDDAAGADSALKFKVPAAGDYVLEIRDQFGRGGPDFAYRIELTLQQPGVVLSIPQVARNDSQSRQFIAVPRGGRIATMISAKRTDFAGDLRFNVDGLPRGVKMTAELLSAKLEQEPLLFEAASDAPIAGKFAGLFAGPVDTSKSVSSSYRHEVDFIAGPNNSYYYSTHESELYVAVCESAPFAVRIEELHAPLVQSGSLDMKIMAERRADFSEPINVKMMWKPPGVSALPDVTIKKGENSVIYQLNAKSDAEARQWKIAVLGSANVDGGPVYVSSQLAPLEIAEPFVVGTVAAVTISPGQEAKLICKLTQRKPFEGRAHVHIRGLPDQITASDGEISSADKEVVFTLRADAGLAPASYRNFLCTADIIHNGQIIPHNLANGAVIRVVPPKKAAAAPERVAKSETRSK